MIENIGRIQTNCEALGLRDLNLLLNGHVEGPDAQALKRALPKVPTLTRKRMLQHNASLSVLDRDKRARRRETCRDNTRIETLRVLVGGINRQRRRIQCL